MNGGKSSTLPSGGTRPMQGRTQYQRTSGLSAFKFTADCLRHRRPVGMSSLHLLTLSTLSSPPPPHQPPITPKSCPPHTSGQNVSSHTPDRAAPSDLVVSYSWLQVLSIWRLRHRRGISQATTFGLATRMPLPLRRYYCLLLFYRHNGYRIQHCYGYRRELTCACYVAPHQESGLHHGLG